MRSWLLFLLLTVALGLIAGTVMGFDSGYVLLSWGNYVLETSLGLAAVLLLLGVFVLYMLMRTSMVLLGSDWRFNEWRANRRNQRARRQTTRGLLELAQGQWRRAERLLTAHADDSDTPLINYLAAARAAFEQGKYESVEEWLQSASQTTRGAELAVGISQADLLNSRGQKEQALAVLLKLRQQHPKHPYILKLIAKLYMELEDWKALQELIPLARKFTRIPDEKLRELEEKVGLQNLEREAHNHASGNQLKKLYHDVPRQSRYSVAVAKRYIELLLEHKEEALAEQELRDILKNTWHDDLLRLYGTVKGEDAKSQLLFAEKQLTERTNDPVLLWVLGNLALRTQNLAKAKDYLSMGLRIRNLPELHTTMAKICLLEGNETRACEHFQLAL